SSTARSPTSVRSAPARSISWRGGGGGGGAGGAAAAAPRVFCRLGRAPRARPPPGGPSAVPQPVALISYELWQSAYGAQAIVGHSVDVDGRRLQVVGVLARGADLMDTHTEIWLPLGFTDNERQARENHNLTLIGRVKD